MQHEMQHDTRQALILQGFSAGSNPIGIIIPCHRVVGSGGNLTGFGGGIQAKTELLRLEGADMKSFYVPKKGTAL